MSKCCIGYLIQAAGAGAARAACKAHAAQLLAAAGAAAAAYDLHLQAPADAAAYLLHHVPLLSVLNHQHAAVVAAAGLQFLHAFDLSHIPPLLTLCCQALACPHVSGVLAALVPFSCC